MKIKGVNYDVGIALNGSLLSRPSFDQKTGSDELAIIKNELHCNAVRICGTDITRLKEAALAASALGLEVWLSPQLHDESMETTQTYIAEVAKMAELLRQRSAKIVLVVGSELTLFMQGILEGRTLFERLNNPAFEQTLRSGQHNAVLNDFIEKVVTDVRKVFKGQITYASVPFEAVNWDLFDIVSVDHYRETSNYDSYASSLAEYERFEKPVVVTEFGCATFKGAGALGANAWMIMDLGPDPSKPPVGLRGKHVRDEHEQATELNDQLHELAQTKIEGAFVYTFIAPLLSYNDNPQYDFDMASYSLVRSMPQKEDASLTWIPKESFAVVADFFVKGFKPLQ